MKLLITHTDGMPQSESSPLWARIAYLEASLGLLADAAEHFGRAGNEYVLDELIMRLEMGEFEMVSRRALSLSGTALEETVASDLFAVYVMSLSRLDEVQKALNAASYYVQLHPQHVTPLLWFAYSDIARAAGDGVSQGKARAGMERMYPESASAYLLAGRIKRWVNPSGLIHESEIIENPGKVQTGAFSSRESAATLRYSLERDGFTSWIEQVGALWKVYVNDPDGLARERLSEAGYEFSLGS